MRLNEQTVVKILLKYPTQSELDQALEIEHAAAERQDLALGSEHVLGVDLLRLDAENEGRLGRPPPNTS